MRHRGLASAAGALLWAWATLLCAQTVWKLPTAYPAQTFQTENLVRFAQDVEAATGGKLKIVVHPNGVLYKAPQILPAVEKGDAQMGDLLMSEAAKDIPIMGLDSLPFLTEGYDGARALWRLSRPTTEKVLNQRGLVVLYAVGWPPQGIYASKSIDGINDLKGLRFRAYNPATTRVAELMQAQPINVPRPDLTKALSKGDLGAMFTSSSTGVELKIWDYMKFYYDVNAWIPKNVVLVNKRAYDALDPATRD